MTLKTTVLFDVPQQDISSILLKAIRDCQKMSMVTGFLTVEGAKVLLPALHSSPSKLKTLVVGAGTYRGFEALDELLSNGVSRDCLHIHLGYTRPTTSAKAKHSFYRYHPMLHSKVSLFEMANGETVAFVGSHNITGFALLGLNGEASVMLEGKTTDPEIQKIKRHISISQSQSVLYEPSKKEAYAWWTKQFLDGLTSKASLDIPKDFESQKTIVFLGAQSEGNALKKGDVIYFEIPANLKQIRALQSEVHIYILDSVPSSPMSALSSIKYVRRGFSCKVAGVEVEEGGLELQADWYIPDRFNPKLSPTPKPFRPKTSATMQQVRVTVKDEIKYSYEYFFDNTRETWKPVIEITNEPSILQQKI
jgi:HKD family nuclease